MIRLSLEAELDEDKVGRVWGGKAVARVVDIQDTERERKVWC